MSEGSEAEKPSFLRSQRIVYEWATGIKREPGESFWSYSQKLRGANWQKISFVFLLGIPSYVAIIYYTLPYSLPFFRWIFAFVSSVWKPENSVMIGGFGVAGALIIGLLLAIFRRDYQMMYGLVEIVVSCTICFYTFQSATETHTFLAVAARIIPAIYFTTRGFTNVIDGIKEAEAKDAELQISN